ncbi:metallophosphoesterase [Sphingobacterium sp. 2149]|uniref:metallophosphoesterase n=1 Tax=Sphingobacterium sp. 2149 TaxID=2817763 RepID=UPI00285D5450|nr:metallophosphoesterase [Sphingobacterium sp. 2149]MDR6734649.1 putative MPP superfamily phosphohydrolase [Sphingobacterium sp. 2149]
MAKRLLFILFLFIVGDFYFFQAFITVAKSSVFQSIYWCLDLLLLLGVFALFFLRKAGHEIQRSATSLITAFLIVFIPKLIAIPFLLLEDLTRIFRSYPPRSVLLSEIILLCAVLMLLIIFFGLTRGRYFYRVREEIVSFPDLPEAFNGFKITQLSDIHSGSLSDMKRVRKGIELANAQNSDLVLFTGDLVNNRASEMEPWVSEFNRLQAPFGKFSVLGNHDYGDYVQWDSVESKISNLNRLKEIHHEMGFKLLLNESIAIEKQGDRISLIGVENWGKGGFHQYGDLAKATIGLNKDTFKILMSHDPSHWDHVTLDHDQHVHLTLAGHTHGMQFGIELFGFKWSPIQYFYKQWAGLYQKHGKYLYVNRGFGFHGLRGRIGVWPEITVVTLRKSD